MQLISHAAKRWSWFPAFQTASDSAYFLRCRQLRIRLISHVQTASDLLIQLISKPDIRLQSQLIFHVTESFWFSWFPTWQTASGFSWFNTWHCGSQLLIELISHLTDSFLFSWFPWWQTASVWANFPCDRQLLTQLISIVGHNGS